MYKCEVVADSVSPTGHRMVTFSVVAPRFLTPQINMHGRLSKSAQSSRAVPVEKSIAAVERGGFVPSRFGRNQRGMQSREWLEGNEALFAEGVWRKAMQDAITAARELSDLGVHKQFANRVLEPFAWQSTVLTATEWLNFFRLRIHGDAQPEFRTLADLMHHHMSVSKPRQLRRGQWHLPFVRETDLVEHPRLTDEEWAMVSAARCARTSYVAHDGTRDPSKDLKLASRLLRDGHMNPFEHQGVAMPWWRRLTGSTSGNLNGFWQHRKMVPGEAIFAGSPDVQLPAIRR